MKADFVNRIARDRRIVLVGGSLTSNLFANYGVDVVNEEELPPPEEKAEAPYEPDNRKARRRDIALARKESKRRRS